MQCAVVINSFNRKQLLIQAVESLVRAIDPRFLDYAIVVFEAGSNDGSREWLSAFSRENLDVCLEVIEALEGEDSSFASGVNRGCAFALERYPDVEFLLLYETDNWLGSLEPISAAIDVLRKNSNLAAMGFTVRLHSGRPCGWGTPFPTVSSFALGGQLSQRLEIPSFQKRTQVTDGIKWFVADVVYTSPLLIKAPVWSDSGGIDARLFPFSDSDIDWAWRIAAKGYQLGVLETGAVIHDNLSTISSWSSMRVVDFHRARFRLLRKYRGLTVVMAIPALFVRHSIEYVVLLALVLCGRRPSVSLKKRAILLKSVWRGYRAS